MKSADLRHTVWLLASAAILLSSVASAQDTKIGTVHVDGQLDHALVVTASDLTQRPQHEQQATFDSNQGPQSHRYRGVSLFGLLEECGIKAELKQIGGLLDRYVVATGADGYQVVFSMGEIANDFGHKDVLLATRTDGDASAQSVLYTTAPGDAKGGRYVANVTRLEVRAPPPATHNGTVAAASVMLSGAVQKSLTLDVAALSALPQSIEVLSGVQYRGVSLWTLLGQAGWQPDPELKNAMLSMFVVAEGRDGYRAIFSMAELSPEFGDQRVLVALPVNASGGSAPATDIRLVVPGDAMHRRSVRQLARINVETALPDARLLPAPQ